MSKEAKIYWTLQEAEGDLLGLLNDSDQKLLTDKEFSRLNSMKVHKRKCEWLLGRLTAKALISSPGLPLEYQPWSSIEIGNHSEGAPFVSNPPDTGNLTISHRRNIALCAFTADADQSIGIDLEEIEPREMSFVEDFFTAEEADYTRELSEKNRHIWVTLVWSAKEAILKAWQKGLRLDTRSIQIFPISGESIQSHTAIWKTLNWQAKIDGYPACWVGWQRWKNFIITLATTTPPNSSWETIVRIDLQNFPPSN